jgi:hypothetical protein
MFVANNQQWCSVRFHSSVPGAQPNQSGSIMRLPTHGDARISTGPSGVLFWYRPAPQFTGSDEFVVEYGSGTQTVAVTVRGPQGGDAKPAAAQAAPSSAVAATASFSPMQDGAHPLMSLPAGALISLRCLPSGTEQTYSTGESVKWLGYDPSSSDLCIGRNKNGHPVQRVRGIWGIGSYWPDGIPAVRQAMTRLQAAPPGTPVSFVVTGKSSTADDPRPGTWSHMLAVAGEERITVGAGTFDAVIIEDSQQGMDGNTYRGTARIWVDRNSGAVLRWDTSGISNGQHTSWETTSLRLP